MDKPPPRRPFQFSLGSLMLFVTLFAVLMSALGGMIRIQSGEKLAMPHAFLIMAIAAPMGLAILVSGALALRRWYERRKK